MNKKKACLFIAAILTLLCFSSCSDNAYTDDEDELKIVATIFPQYDFARKIGENKISLKMLVSPGGESHSYEPTPQDIIAVKNCDIFICTGGKSDVWSNVILSSIDTENITVIKMIECVDAVEEEITEGMKEKISTEEEDELEYDEHVWTSLKNAKKIASEIGNAMISKDKNNEKYFRGNLNDFLNELDSLDSEYENAVKQAKKNTLIFGDRFPFRYLFEDYGLEYYAAFPGCSTESDVSAKNMMFLINKIKEEKLPAVYYIEFSARKIADTISEETGAEPLLFHSCHTVSKSDFENGITYTDLMKQNLENLKRGLEIESDRM
ncbi:MAG: metal ABC transporter substrate-binding protein [Firmicutes bacterium]|nr:metal ABC transporter substrate-binding protein [Bacillota bacterium]